jgi:hypothetical protein
MVTVVKVEKQGRGRKRTLATAKRNAQIKNYRERGWTLARIAEKYGISTVAVHLICNDPKSHEGVARKPGRKKAA